MQRMKALFAVLLVVSAGLSQIVNISGKVIDNAGAAISGAIVKLEKGDQADTTESNGSFTLTGGTSVISSRICNAIPYNISATTHNGLLFINVMEKAVIDVSICDLNGKSISRIQQPMDVGIHSIPLFHYTAGILVCKVKSGISEIVLKSNYTGGVLHGTEVFVQNNASYATSAGQSKVTAAIDDFITATKTGYSNYRQPIKTSDTSGIEIRMVDTNGITFLASIPGSSTSVEYTYSSGGTLTGMIVYGYFQAQISGTVTVAATIVDFGTTIETAEKQISIVSGQYYTVVVDVTASGQSLAYPSGSNRTYHNWAVQFTSTAASDTSSVGIGLGYFTSSDYRRISSVQ